MNFAEVNNTAFTATLVTKGRKTGNEHSVWLRAVMYNDKIFFSGRLSSLFISIKTNSFGGSEKIFITSAT